MASVLCRGGIPIPRALCGAPPQGHPQGHPTQAAPSRPIPRGIAQARAAAVLIARPVAPLESARRAGRTRGRRGAGRGGSGLLVCAAVAGEVGVRMEEEMGGWLVERGMPGISVRPAVFEDRQGYAAARDISAGEVVLEVPEDLAITIADVQKDAALAAVAEGKGELVALTLWLMVERLKGEASPWYPFLRTLPERTLSPITWTPDERNNLLKGSPVLGEATARVKELEAQWEELSPSLTADPSTFPPAAVSLASFVDAFSVVVGRAVFLPSAECFALLPVASAVRRVPGGPILDYDFDKQSVVLVAAQGYVSGDEVIAGELERRPNTELFLTYGLLEPDNPSDFLEITAELLPADRLYEAKRQVVESEGLSAMQAFPVFEDRLPLQLLSYLRLSRVQDVAQLAKISFTKDVEVSQMNEYEVLQLLMGECREKLDEYEGDMESEINLMKLEMSDKERAAAKLRLREKQIWTSTMDAVRRRLAPIRGIPTKGGEMMDPNQDLLDIFNTIENIPNAPKKALKGFTRWLSGADDPDFRR